MPLRVPRRVPSWNIPGLHLGIFRSEDLGAKSLHGTQCDFFDFCFMLDCMVMIVVMMIMMHTQQYAVFQNRCAPSNMQYSKTGARPGIAPALFRPLLWQTIFQNRRAPRHRAGFILTPSAANNNIRNRHAK